MRIICWQTILMKYHSLFLSKIKKDVEKFVVCCSVIDALRVNIENPLTVICLALKTKMKCSDTGIT